MLQALKDIAIYLDTGNMTIFLIYWTLVMFFILPRQILAGVFYTSRSRGWIQNYPEGEKEIITALVTVYNEREEDLERALSKLKKGLEKGAKKYSIIVIVDGYSSNKNPTPSIQANQRLAAIAKKYADIVLCTNATWKRKNLENMVRFARERGVLYRISLFVDSDTFVEDDTTIGKLMRPFFDPKIGGVTTSQLIENPNNWVRKISFWLEYARQVSSMGAGSLLEQVLCLPGRMYAIRTELIEDKMDDLVNDSFSFLWWGPWTCYAGDDRFLTNCVLKAGYGTVMVPEAKITTSVPGGMLETLNMWLRWGRSSQGYTLRSLWLLKPRYWLAAFISWGDIFITVSTVYIVAIHWPYSFITGTAAGTLVEMALFAVTGMCLTVIMRQMPLLVKHPEYFKLIPAFLLMVTIGQFIRFWALLTPHKIGSWGTRGIKAGAKKVYCWEFNPRHAPDDVLDILLGSDTLNIDNKTRKDTR